MVRRDHTINRASTITRTEIESEKNKNGYLRLPQVYVLAIGMSTKFFIDNENTSSTKYISIDDDSEALLFESSDYKFLFDGTKSDLIEEKVRVGQAQRHFHCYSRIGKASKNRRIKPEIR